MRVCSFVRDMLFSKNQVHVRRVRRISTLFLLPASCVETNILLECDADRVSLTGSAFCTIVFKLLL